MENISNKDSLAFVDSEEEAEEEEDEALSLCDLPLTRPDESTKQNKEEEEEDVTNTNLRHIINETEEDDFDFCSLISTESEMCAADEVFYQGQILPLRRSIRTRDFISSRSSSIGSHHSSSSSSSSSTEPKPPPPNQFHYSHPSPSSPRPHFSGNRRGLMPRSIQAKKSSAWNIFRLGLVAAPPEISFHDLKIRRPGNNININLLGEEKTMRIKKRDFLSGCKLCAADVVDTVPSKIVREIQFPAPKKRSTSHRRTLKQLKRGAAPDQH